MKCDHLSLLIPIVLFFFLLGSCHTTRHLDELVAKNAAVQDPYIGLWDFVVRNTPTGNAEGVISIEKEGYDYRASLESELGEMSLDHLSIKDERLKGYFRYKGFRVNVKGVFEENTLAGKLAVTLASFPLEATKRTH